MMDSEFSVTGKILFILCYLFLAHPSAALSQPFTLKRQQKKQHAYQRVTLIISMLPQGQVMNGIGASSIICAEKRQIP